MTFSRLRLNPTAAALGVVLGVYSWLAFFYLPAGVYWTPDVGLKRIQAANVRWDAGLDLSLDYPGRALDPALRFLPFRENFYYLHQGRVRFSQPPVIAVLSRPLLAWFGPRGEPVMALIAGLVCAWLTARLARSVGAEPAWPAALLAGLATPLMVYSPFLWEHTLGAALALGAVVIAFGTRVRWPHAALAGLLLGLAGAVRKELLLLAPVLLMVMGRRGRRLGAACAGAFGLPLLAWWAYAFAASGHPVPPEFRISTTPGLTSLSYFWHAGLGLPADFVFDPRYGGLGDALLLAVVAYALVGWKMPAPWRDLIQAAALAALLAGAWLNRAEPLASGALFGLLSASPFLALAWAGPLAPPARTLRSAAGAYYALTALALGVMTPAGPYLSGLEWGARYSLLAFPLAAPPAWLALRQVWERARTPGQWAARIHFALAVGLSLWSGVWMLTGVSRMRQPTVDAGTRAALLALAEPAVVTNLWWLSAAAPDLYLTRPLFLVDSDEDLRAWLAAARDARITGFVFVSYAPLSEGVAAGLAPPDVRLEIEETRLLPNGMTAGRFTLTDSRQDWPAP